MTTIEKPKANDEGAANKGRDRPERKPWAVRLYLGEIGYDFIGHRKTWYAVSAAVLLICIGSMIFNQFNLGVEFAGGERFRSPGGAEQLAEVTEAVAAAGAEVTSAQAVGDNQLVIITADLSNELGSEVSAAIADSVGVAATDVTNTTTSASWGRDVTSKALQGLLVFVVLVIAFLAVRFQWKMAAGAMVALIHDLVITAGVYSVVGFEVTPASVIGLLTILGFSLYDTVVVFDKIDENTKGLLASQRRTYSEAANLAINQVLMRSINTSIFALLPVLGLLYAGVFLIGEGTLQDLALVLFVGLVAGIYSSIFLAAPVVCELKEREPDYQKLAKRVRTRRAGTTSTKRTGRKAAAPAFADELDVDSVDVDRDDADLENDSADDLGRGVHDSGADDVDDDDVEADDADDVDDAEPDRIRGRDDGAAKPQDRQAEDRPAPVASARRSGPRTSVSASGKGAAKPASGSTGSGSAGSRLAPRPGAKPVRGTRKPGSSKRGR